MIKLYLPTKFKLDPHSIIFRIVRPIKLYGEINIATSPENGSGNISRDQIIFQSSALLGVFFGIKLYNLNFNRLHLALLTQLTCEMWLKNKNKNLWSNWRTSKNKSFRWCSPAALKGNFRFCHKNVNNLFTYIYWDRSLAMKITL